MNQGVRHLFSEEGIDEAGYMTTVTVQAGVCKGEPPATPEDASRAAEPAAQPTTPEMQAVRSSLLHQSLLNLVKTA